MHDSWEGIVQKAKSEKKLLFVDFYTQWCGPCYNMATEVFTQPNVSVFYNANFICAKIDAESDEGKKLAQKYGVRSYPTYAFIDPITENMVHYSSSRQSPEAFIYTGHSALTPTLRSTYLQGAYEEGNRNPQFLIDYIRYNNSIYAKQKVEKAFDELMQSGVKLTDKAVWNVFVEAVSGITPYLQEVSDNYDTYCQLFGKESVDAKFDTETQYGDLAAIERLCDFKNKAFNCEMIRISNMIYRQKDYETAISHIDALIADPSIDKQQLINRLQFMVRISHYNVNDVPRRWYEKCLEYLRYIAYNNSDRQNANVHYEYALALEQLIRQQPSTKDIPGVLLDEPAYGKKEYSMRPDALKMKPRTRHK